MRILKTFLAAAIASATCSQMAAAQTPPPPAAITNHPFSAIKYTRTIHIGTDGKPTITAEQRHMMVARDQTGRVFMTESGSAADESCDLPNVGKLPVCDDWFIVVFDPTVGRLWHWGTGRVDDATQYVEFTLDSDQLAEDKRLTSAPPVPRIEPPTPEVRMQDLGEKTIEGLTARGIRTVTLHNDATGGQPKLTIHEVWTSIDMDIVLKVIDGDPSGNETVSGLEHISLANAPALFQLPTDRILRRISSAYFDGDKDTLAAWLVH